MRLELIEFLSVKSRSLGSGIVRGLTIPAIAAAITVTIVFDSVEVDADLFGTLVGADSRSKSAHRPKAAIRAPRRQGEEHRREGLPRYCQHECP